MATSNRNRSQSKQSRPATAQQQERTLGRSAWEWTKSLFIGFLLFLVIRTFVIQTWTVISGSMEDTLLVGDFLVLSKSAYGATIPGTDETLPGYTTPDRAHIVVFRGHHEPIDLVKRLVGVPADPGPAAYFPRMEWPLPYPATPEDARVYRLPGANWGPMVVLPLSYFLTGDNLDQPLDSRYWGFVPMVAIKGKAGILYFDW